MAATGAEMPVSLTPVVVAVITIVLQLPLPVGGGGGGGGGGALPTVASIILSQIGDQEEL